MYPDYYSFIRRPVNLRMKLQLHDRSWLIPIWSKWNHRAALLRASTPVKWCYEIHYSTICKPYTNSYKALALLQAQSWWPDAVVAKYANDICLGEEISLGKCVWGHTFPWRTHITVTLVINILVEMSFFVSPTAMQRRLSDRSWEQHLKNGKKRAWNGASDAIVAAMWPPYQRNPHGLSPYCATCRKYEANTRLLKTSGEIGSRVWQTREQATWLITVLVMFTKLRRLSWKSSAQERGVLRQPRSGVFCLRCTTEDGEEVRCLLHAGKLTVHQIPCVVGTRISPWSWLGPKRTARQTQRRPILLRVLTWTLNQMRINLLQQHAAGIFSIK